MEYFISAPTLACDIPQPMMSAICETHGSYETFNTLLASGCNTPEQIAKFEEVIGLENLDRYNDINLTLYSGSHVTTVLSGVPQTMLSSDIAAVVAKTHGIIYVSLNVDMLMSSDQSYNYLRFVTEMALSHEMVHVDQMLRGDMDMTPEGVVWKGVLYPTAELLAGMQDGASKGDAGILEQQFALPWEQEAYANSTSWDAINKMVDGYREIYTTMKTNYEQSVAV